MIWEFILLVGVVLPIRTLTEVVRTGTIIYYQERNLICNKDIMSIKVILENSKMSFRV